MVGSGRYMLCMYQWQLSLTATSPGFAFLGYFSSVTLKLVVCLYPACISRVGSYCGRVSRLELVENISKHSLPDAGLRFQLVVPRRVRLLDCFLKFWTYLQLNNTGEISKALWRGIRLWVICHANPSPAPFTPYIASHVCLLKSLTK